MTRARMLLVAHWDWVFHNFRLHIARALREAGADVKLVCPPGPHTAGFADEGFEWLRWPVERRGRGPGAETVALARLWRIYRQQRPDVVHHYTLKPNLYGTVAALGAGVGHVTNVFTGLGHLFSEEPGARRLRRRLLPVMRRVFTRDRVWMLTSNDADLEELRSRGLAVAERSRVMPEGVDVDRFRPADRQAPGAGTRAGDGAVRVIYAARLLRQKGLIELLEAASRAAAEGCRLKIVVAGEPDEGNPDALTPGELDRWRGEPFTEFLGHRSDMPVLLRSADIAALPSYYREGMPRFLLEAAASGLPLVASDIPANRTVVKPGVNGVLVPPRDTRQLAAALVSLARDPEQRSSYGAASREIAEGELSNDRVQQAHVELYRRLGVLA